MLGEELQPWFLRLQWKTCPWAEHSDDDFILLLCGFGILYSMFRQQCAILRLLFLLMFSCCWRTVNTKSSSILSSGVTSTGKHEQEYISEDGTLLEASSRLGWVRLGQISFPHTPKIKGSSREKKCVPMPTHCTITRFRFHARRIDGVECGLFSNHAPLGQTTLRVGRVSVQCTGESWD